VRRQNNVEPCEKRCKTIMIGALSEFEKNFGSLWGHDLDRRDKTREQKEWEEVWLEARERILDLGNSQIKKYFYEVKIVEDRNDRRR
jgi:hypothetical protein